VAATMLHLPPQDTCSWQPCCAADSCVPGNLLQAAAAAAENPHGGWDATNEATGKKVRIKSAQRLRGPWKRPQNAKKPKGEPPPKAKKERKDATRAKRGRQGAKRGRQGAKRASCLDAAATVLPEPPSMWMRSSLLLELDRRPRHRTAQVVVEVEQQHGVSVGPERLGRRPEVVLVPSHA